MTGTIFPVTINSLVNINALYDTGAARICMNYDTFFNLGLDLDDKATPPCEDQSGTDIGAIGFTTLPTAINDHIFTQQFTVCRSQTRSLLSGQDVCVHHSTGCDWTPHSTKRFTINQKVVLEIDDPEADQFFGVKKSVNIPPSTMSSPTFNVDLKQAATLRPDEALKRTIPSMWADTYYIDPFKVGIEASTQLTIDFQINQTQVESIPINS